MSRESDSPVTLTLLDGFRIKVRGREIFLSSRKDRAVIVYLALNAGRIQPRENLAAMLWGDTTDSKARRNLRHCLHTLRGSLGDGVASDLIVSGREGVHWPLTAAAVDVHRLRALVSNGTAASVMNAASLFRGPLLDGFVTGEGPFDEWLDDQRRSVLRLLETLVEKLTAFAPGQVDERVAIKAARNLVSIDTLNENAQRLLIKAYLVGGRRVDAVRQYQSCVETLRSELGIGPDPATESLYRSVVSAPTQSSPAKPQATLPKQVESLAEVDDAIHFSDWPSVAVLPFEMAAADAEDTFLGQGIANEIIELLYRYRWLRVIARDSSFNYRTGPNGPKRATRDLHVRYVLHGSVQRSNDRVRCMAQVLDAANGSCVWANHFDRKLDDIFLLIDELACSVVGELEPALGRIERRRSMRVPSNDLSAWCCYHRGLEHFYRFRREDNAIAISLLERACFLEPEFSPAYAQISIAREWSVMHGFALSREASLNDARRAAKQAVDLDPECALARYARSRINLRETKYAEAISDIEEAKLINPSFSGGHFASGIYYNCTERFAETHSAIENAMRLSPRDPQLGYFYALRARAFLGQRRHTDAKDWARRGLNAPNANPLPLLSTLVSALGYLDAEEESAQAVKQLEKITQQPRTIRLYRDLMAPTVGAGFLEYFLDGLRRAGIPE